MHDALGQQWITVVKQQMLWPGNVSNLINDRNAYLHPSLSNWNWWCWNAVSPESAACTLSMPCISF